MLSKPTIFTGLFVLLITGCLSQSSQLRAENWPQWRGPSGLSTSQETNIPTSWSATTNIAWTLDLPEYGSSTPAIWGNAIFLTVESEDQLQLLKINRETKSVEWRRIVGTGTANRKMPKGSSRSPKYHDIHNMASPSPVTNGKVVIAHFGNGDLAAYNFSGEQLWKRNLSQEYGTYSIWWGHANSPIIYDNLVISACMQDSLADLADKPTPSYLVAHHLQTGEEVWLTPRMTEASAEECDSYTTPLIRKTEQGDQLVLMGGNQLDGYNPTTGKLLWHVPGLVGGRTITGPTLAEGLVYATVGMRGDLFAINPEKISSDLETTKLWAHRNNTPDTCCPVTVGDLLFTISDKGIATCLNRKTGKSYWRKRVAGGNHKASPIAVENRVYFLSTDGRCTVVKADETYQKVAENKLDDEFIASPAISNGQIFLRGKQKLYVIGTR